MRRFLLFVVGFAVTLPACSPDEDDSSTKSATSKKERSKPMPSEAPKSPPEKAEEAIGTIRGIVKFDGKMIPAKPIVMATDPYCTKYYQGKEPPLRETWKWGQNSTLQNVVVSISKGLPQKQYQLHQEDAVLDQIGCRYFPHVMVIGVGQTLQITNHHDETLHSPNLRLPGPGVPPMSFDPAGVRLPFKLKFQQREVLFIRCDVHAWMSAYIHIMDHPFHAVTGEDGTFEIKGLPPGEYELTAWHEFRRFKAAKNPIVVKVEIGKVKDVVFTYSPTKD